MSAADPTVGLTDWFVGREHESGTALHLLEVASAGATRVVLLAGEPGIGKTRLMQQIGEHARLRGATVLSGGASQAEGMPPYLPFLEALGPYIRAVEPELLREQAGQWAAPLAGILPELTARLGDVPAGYPLPPEQARLRLFEAVGAFLSAIGAVCPLILLFDDLQWSDPSTLDLLCYVTRSRPAARLLIVGAYREGEAEGNTALEGAIAELTRQRRLTTIHIGPLSPEEMCELAAKHLDGPITPDLCRLLYAQSEGNPFFAEELLRGWLEKDALACEESGWAVSGESEHILPPSIVGAVRQRLARLPADVVEDLRVAAILGRSFDLTVLSAATGQEAETVEDRLSQAARAHLVETDGDGTYSFHHDRIRESLYAEVTATRRRRLHEAIGCALEDRQRTRTVNRLAELAFHFARSADRERGVAYSRQAADEALRHWAIEEALAHYRTALDLLEADDERRGEVLLEVADAALLAGREEEAVVGYEAAQGVLAARDPVAAARAAHGLGMARLRQDALHETQVAFEAALTLLRGHRGPETVRVLADLATFLCVCLGQQEEGEAQAHLALELAGELQDKRLEAAAGRTVGNLQVRGNKIPEGIRRLEQALALARAADDLAEAGECYACLANAYYWSAELDRARECWLMREELARRCQQPYELRHVYTWFAFIATTQGDWEEAERQFARSRPVVERLASSEPFAFLRQVRGFLAWERKDYAQAERELEAAIALYREHSPGTLAWYLGPLALAQLAAGKREEALSSLVELDELIAALPSGSLPTAPALICAMLLAVRLGDSARAAGYYAPLSAFGGQLHWFLADRALAGFAMMSGDRSGAEAYLDRAERTARRAGMRQVLAGILEERARLARDEGGSALPAGLSQREAEVLRLVAAGRSNRDIARELHLSENTVAKHLTSIFNKTASDNRAAAAAFALRHGLLQ
jgi:predicted ATPase/DNA-binding CsgD family transcriptional regulator